MRRARHPLMVRARSQAVAPRSRPNLRHGDPRRKVWRPASTLHCSLSGRDLALLAFGPCFNHLVPMLRDVEEIAFRVAGAIFRKRTVRWPFLGSLHPELLDAA